MTSEANRAGAILTIDRPAIVENYHALRAILGRTECSAVVKADSYGLGAVPVSQALQDAGCRTFFVAHLEEGLTLRQGIGQGSRIFVLNGLPHGQEKTALEAGIIPVLNTMGQIRDWSALCQTRGEKLPAAVQVDSGMSRLGLQPVEVAQLANDGSLLTPIDLQLIMSHLACADELDHPANEEQRLQFAHLAALLPNVPLSLANSSGIFRGESFRHDLARPGAALYGLNPTPWTTNPLRNVLRLRARIIQTREIEAGAGIGYAMIARATEKMRLATLSIGYADGFARAYGGASASFNGRDFPIIGRVSMDSIMIDISASHEAELAEGMFVDLMNDQHRPDDYARLGGTIGYEVLTRLGSRLYREYL